MPAEAGALTMSGALQPAPGLYEDAVRDLRDSLTCQICLKLLYEPFTTSCGHTYCYECLNQWFAGNGDGLKKTCPDCRSRIRHQPAPAFLVRQMVEVLCKRNELLPDGETVDEHTQMRQEMVSLVDKHKSDTSKHGGLFEGRFAHPDRPNAFYSADENIWRCPSCHNELEDHYCEACELMFDEEGNPVRNYDEETASDISADDSYIPGREELIQGTMFDMSARPPMFYGFGPHHRLGPAAVFHHSRPDGGFSSPSSNMDSGSIDDSLVLDDEDDEDDEDGDDLSDLIDDGGLTSEAGSDIEGSDGDRTPSYDTPVHGDGNAHGFLDHGTPEGTVSSDTLQQAEANFSDLEEAPERTSGLSAGHREDYEDTLDARSFNYDVEEDVGDDDDDEDDETGGYNMAGTGAYSDNSEPETTDDDESPIMPRARKRQRAVLEDSDDEPVRAPQRQRTNWSQIGRGDSLSRYENGSNGQTSNTARYSTLEVPEALSTYAHSSSRPPVAHVDLTRPLSAATASRAQLRADAERSDELSSNSEGVSDEGETGGGSEGDSEDSSESEPDEAPARAAHPRHRNMGFQAPRRVSSIHAQQKSWIGSQSGRSGRRFASRGR